VRPSARRRLNEERSVFVRNHWYVAAWDKEVGRKPLARTV
jgi:phenylpropionate dioxygenase-like ring-hydroxylating dioxygenase large terminal subunit